MKHSKTRVPGTGSKGTKEGAKEDQANLPSINTTWIFQVKTHYLHDVFNIDCKKYSGERRRRKKQFSAKP